MSKSENIVEFPDLKAIEEEAAVWVAQLDSRGVSGINQKELDDWLNVSVHHLEAFERMAALWVGADILDALNYKEGVEEARKLSRRNLNATRWIKGIAATFVVAASVMLAQYVNNAPTTQTAEFATIIGEQKTIRLADGSDVILNTNSEISINLTDTRREVVLLRGEAHFDVAHEPERPFVVYARDGIVKAVGTAFTVHLRREKVEVTVSEGVVAILSRPPDTVNVAIRDVEVDELLPIAALTVGESAVIEEEAVESVVRMSEDALDRKLLWRGGFIAFAGEPLSTVVADVSRYTDILIEIDDPSLETLPIGGYFKVGEVEDMFESLEASFGITVTRISPSRVLLSRTS